MNITLIKKHQIEDFILKGFTVHYGEYMIYGMDDKYYYALDRFSIGCFLDKELNVYYKDIKNDTN